MDFALSEEQQILRDQIVQFARERLNAGVQERDREHRFAHELWLECGEMGLQGLSVPVEHGGSGLDALSTAIALEALGYGCEDGGLVFALCAHLLACVVPVCQHGSPELKRKYLPDLATGKLIAVNAMTEPGTGSDAFAMATTAVRDGADFVINGTKTFGSNGPIADVALTYALTDPAKGYAGGITAFLVEKGAKGFRPGQRFEKMGLRTSPISELIFEDVRVPAANVVGHIGGGGPMFAQSKDWERTCLFASHVGAMQRLLEKAVAYARTRKQFGQSIGKFQAISHRLADMKVRLEAGRLLVYKGASRLEHSRTSGLDASIAKLFVSESLVQSALDAVQTLGGYGFMVEYDVERGLRDAVGSTIYSGTSEMQRNIIASWLGL
jgi:alkylation response protein AidB-like acyl-CoA dehydrogenase